MNRASHNGRARNDGEIEAGDHDKVVEAACLKLPFDFGRQAKLSAQNHSENQTRMSGRPANGASNLALYPFLIRSGPCQPRSRTVMRRGFRIVPVQ